VPAQQLNASAFLVVDDERMIRQLNTEVLSCSGYQVDAAENGAVAWTRCN